MELALSTWPEVESYLARSRGIVIPIGSMEQHGPIGLIGTDALCAETIATALGRAGDILVGPTIALSVAQFNLDFPGTVSVRATTLMALIEDYVRSLAHAGFARFYFLNGHGANIHAARAAFQDIYGAYSLRQISGPAVRCRLRSWWEYPSVDRMRREWYGEAEGMHATPSEVAITQYANPNTMRRTTLPSPPTVSAQFLRDHGGDNHWDAATHRNAFPDGRVGSDSALASPAAGRQLVEAAVVEALADYRAFLAEA